MKPLKNMLPKLAICCALLPLSGCVKLWTDRVETKTYMIEAPQHTAPALQVPLADKLWVDTVAVLPPFNVRNLLFRKNDIEFETSYYTGLLLSPAENFRNEFYKWFSASGIFREVSLSDRYGMSHRLLVSVLRFNGDDSRDPGQAVLEIKVTLLDERSKKLTVLFSKDYSQRVDLPETTAENLIRAYNQALQTILTECEKDVIQALQTEPAD